MQFNINNNKWNIKIVDRGTMIGKAEDSTVLGYTIYGTQEILLLDEQANILRTLKHELTHVWLWEYGHYQQEKEFTNEDVCEIVASINDFINEIIEKYRNYVEK